MGELNPFRYRGYYYDEDTSFYYLQSRYYDPVTCKFINADDPMIIYQTAYNPLAVFTYDYCNGNPVMYVDPTGYLTIPRWIVSFVLDLIISSIGLGLLFAPVKRIASSFGKSVLRSKLKTPLFNLIRGFGKKISTVINILKKGIRKIPFVGSRLANKINTKALTSMVVGGGVSATTNRLLNIIVNDIDVVLSLGGFISGILDIWSDGKFDHKIRIG